MEQAKFFEELVSKLRKVPLERLGAVVAAMDGKAATRAAVPAAPDAAKGTSLLDLALAVPAKGSKLRSVEREIVLAAFVQAKQNKSAAARLLNMDRKAFERRLANARKAK